MNLDPHSIAFSVHDLFFPVRNDLPPRNISDEATIEPCSEKTQKEIEDIVRWLAKSKQAALLDETLYKKFTHAAFCFSTCALIAGAAQVAAWLGVEL